MISYRPGACLLGVCVFVFAPHQAKTAPFVPNDPYFYTGTPTGFPGQWHLDSQTSGALVDVNIRGAWDRGLTGAGVTIGIIEDSFEYRHPDLAPNYAPEHSWDFFDNEPDPAINPDGTGFSAHATAVAGVAAARGDNGIGITGAAPHAELAALAAIGNIAATDYDMEIDSRLGQATKYEASDDGTGIDIYSMSSNPSVGIAYTVWPQFEAGIQSATASGAIHVHLAHNQRESHALTYVSGFGGGGGRNADTSKQAITNMPEVIVVTGMGSNGKYADYSNFGASVFVTAPTGTDSGLRITTTDNGPETPDRAGYNVDEIDDDPFPDFSFTSTFGGTSSATPLVSGVLALAKQAQPDLDTRFAKHLLARTSRVVDSQDESPTGTWITNGAGLSFNNNYGFGLIDADALTLAATQYTAVTPLEVISTGVISVGESVPGNGSLIQEFEIAEDASLEEVQVHLNLGTSHSFTPGDIEATLTSPSGTTSKLFTRNGDERSIANSTLDWTFLSNAFWGESAVGEWVLSIDDYDFGFAAAYDFRQPVLRNFEVTLRSGELVAAAIPEPQAAVLILLGLFSGLGGAKLVR